MGGSNINTVITSREAIIAKCMETAAEKGTKAVNIRAIAKACNVSVGSIYYYFPSKAELICATIEIWKDIFHTGCKAMPLRSFSDCVEWIFTSVKAGLKKYPNFFFAHSMSFANDEKAHGRSVMEQCFSHIKAGLSEALKNDKSVRPDAFTEDFSSRDFVELVFTSLLVLFAQEKESCAVLKEMIRRTVY